MSKIPNPLSHLFGHQLLGPVQLRVTLTISVVVGLTYIVSAGLTYLISTMAEDLKLADQMVEEILPIPYISSLIVVFISGQLGDRLGHRRTLLIACAGFSIGGFILATAQGALMIEISLALCGGSATAIQIVGLGLLQKTVPEGKARVSAFTTYGMAFPLTYLLIPVATANLLDLVSWRLIPIFWGFAGVGIGAMVILLLERKESRMPIGEWLTPLLAGVALASAVRFLDALGQNFRWSADLVIVMLIGALAAVTCAALMRGSTPTSFSFRPIAGPQIRVLLVGVALTVMVGSLTYITIAMEYFYGLTDLQAAIALVPAQAGSIFGAKMIASKAMNHWGIAKSVRHLMLIFGISMLPLGFMQPTTSSWYLICCATLINTMGFAAITVLNTDVMGHASLEDTGQVSSFRGAASEIGSALGMVVLGTSVISAVRMDGGVGDVSRLQLDHLAAGLRIDGMLGCTVVLAGWGALLAVARSPRLRLVTSVTKPNTFSGDRPD